MKAYMYNVISGLYEGERFEDEGRIGKTDGLTNIAPPIPDKGYVPVFNCNSLSWSLVTINEMKERLSKLIY